VSDDLTTPSWASPIRNRRTFEVIVEQLEEALRRGELQPGDRLVERELAEAFGVSRASVREAIRVLEALGLATIPRGPGGAYLRGEPADTYTQLMRLHMALGQYRAQSVVELRALMESWVISQLAADPDEELLATLQQTVDLMSETDVTPDAFFPLDIAFHETLVEAYDNELIRLTLQGCRRVIHEAMSIGLTTGGWDDVRTCLAAEHQELVDLIRAGERDAAAEAIRTHIEKWAEALVYPESAAAPGTTRTKGTSS
jgi:GntR family transcriptional regulator, transcriptional repressor for pyruvate dehydrogenase complex